MDTAAPRRLVIFTRHPAAGTTKTRLIPTLGPEGAARLQKQMTEHALAQARGARSIQDLAIEVRYEGGSRDRMAAWLGAGIDYAEQGGGDLGRRMERAMGDAFGHGAGAVVIIGSDIPGIAPLIIAKAFFALAHTPMVLGPATDGGYYLLGLRGDVPPGDRSRLLRGIAWGTADVLARTEGRAKQLNLDPWHLQPLSDVDRPADLAIWDRARRPAVAAGPERVSVIIPAVDEAKRIHDAVESARAGAVQEILVVDGGSSDNTCARAKAAGARVVESPPPRACQANRGAVEAAGDLLCFLHADTRLPENFAVAIRATLGSPTVSAGAFSLGIAPAHPGSKLVETIANFRSRTFQCPYGDQALFFRARTFFNAGGFPPLPIMEDFELMRRLRKTGRIATRPERVATASRRWKERGVIRTTLINQLVIVAFKMGIAPERLARWYRRGRGV